jgi:hypothetical protein
MTKNTKKPYKLKDGSVAPGVTTILSVLAKPELIAWANRLGLQGIDCFKVRDDKAAIGTLVHSMILADLKGERYNTDDYTKKQIDQAENSFLKYLEWKKGKTIEPIAIEQPMVSEEYRYGGTPDFVGYINKEFTIQDYKSGNRIYDEVHYQLAGYEQLVMENGLMPDGIFSPTWNVLNIPRDNSEDFLELTIKDDPKRIKYWQIFMACWSIWNIRRELKGEK